MVEGQQASELLAVNTGVFIFFFHLLIHWKQSLLTFAVSKLMHEKEKKTSCFFSRNLLPLLARLSAILSSQMLNVCFTNVKGVSSALQGIILKRELPVKYENPLQVQEIAFDFFFTNVLATKPTRSLSAGITCSLQLFSDMFLEWFCYQINHTRGRFCL